MNPIIFWWLGLAIFDAGMLVFYVYWYHRNPDPKEPLVVTLWNFICGVFACLCPLINVFVAVALLIWFVDVPASTIVLFGGPKK